MGSQIITLRVIGNESAHLDVLPHHLLRSHFAMQLTEAVGHAVVGHFGRIGNIRKNGVVHIAIDGFHDGRRQLFAQSFALLIDVAIGTTTEVDALERAGAQLLGWHNLLQAALAVLMYDECLTRL